MFSPQVRHYFDGARGYGQLAEPTHQGLAGSVEHGHFFQLQLDSDGLIQGLVFYCPRCVPAIACGAYLPNPINPLGGSRVLSHRLETHPRSPAP